MSIFILTLYPTTKHLGKMGVLSVMLCIMGKLEVAMDDTGLLWRTVACRFHFSILKGFWSTWGTLDWKWAWRPTGCSCVCQSSMHDPWSYSAHTIMESGSSWHANTTCVICLFWDSLKDASLWHLVKKLACALLVMVHVLFFIFNATL